MKVVAINGSPRKKGNTYHALTLVGEELTTQGISTEIVQIGDKKIQGCLSCNTCAKNKDERCVIDDATNGLIQEMKKADGILLGSPVHYAGVGGTMKSFLDRAFMVAGVNGGLFRHKVGACVTAVRRSGGLPAFKQLNVYLLYSEMVIPASNYWNVIHGNRPGDAVQDEEGKQIMRVLGKNMAWLMKSLAYSKSEILPPEKEKKRYTNFIR
ncbi:MAG: hypothetical protein PWQ84_1750 [Thermotogaceae bacterium]|nr:hypothetical protein [Thermotogaceae bacterium]